MKGCKHQVAGLRLRTDGGRIVISENEMVPTYQLGSLYRSAHCFVSCTRGEGWGMPLLEAMACGACPVATAVGGIPEVLSAPELGWLVPAYDCEAFAAAMVEAASLTSAQRAIMSGRARDHIVTNFNAKAQFNALADVVDSLAVVTPV